MGRWANIAKKAGLAAGFRIYGSWYRAYVSPPTAHRARVFGKL